MISFIAAILILTCVVGACITFAVAFRRGSCGGMYAVLLTLIVFFGISSGYLFLAVHDASEHAALTDPGAIARIDLDQARHRELTQELEVKRRNAEFELERLQRLRRSECKMWNPILPMKCIW